MNLFLAGFSHLQSLCSWLVPNEFYSMLGRTGHQLIQIVFLHRGNCMLFYFWRGENEKTAFAPLFFFFLSTTCQSVLRSHYIEVPQGDILMEQKMWFGLVLSRLAIWKKWSDYEQLLRTVFSYFQGKKRPHWKIAYYLF